MVENVLEYLFSLIDYGCLLFFFHYLNYEKINRMKFIIAIFLMSLVQFLSEFWLLPRYIISIKDFILIFSFFIIYTKYRNARTVLNALIINVLFIFILTLCINVANVIFVDIHMTLVFGIYRIFFTLTIKVLIFMLMYFCLSQLRKLEFDISDKSFRITALFLCLSGFLAAYILQLSEYNREQLFLMVLIEIIVFTLFCFSLTYNMLMRKNYYNLMFQKLILMTESHIEQISNEHKQIEKLIHDTKNQILEMDMLIQQNEKDKAHQYIENWLRNFVYSHEVALCLNVYIDSVLRQKMKDYPMIEFHLKLQIPENIPMKTTDLLSIITIIVEQSCNVIKNSANKIYHLEIKGNEYELSFIERYETNGIFLKKDVFKESYIKELFQKYDGDITTTIENGEITKSFFLIF